LDLGFLSIAPVRRDQLDALLGELGVERVGVICPICDQALGALSEEARCERRFYERDLIRRSVRRAYGERPSAAGARQEDRASKKRVVREAAEHVDLSVQLGRAKRRSVIDGLRVAPRDLQSRLVDDEVLLCAAPLVVDGPAWEALDVALLALALSW
jgi:hypothetical protein